MFCSSFAEIGSQVEEFMEKNTYFDAPNVTLNFKHGNSMGLLFSFLSYPPFCNNSKFYLYNQHNQTVFRSTYFISPFKESMWTFKFLQPSSFTTSFGFPLFSKSFYHEISASIAPVQDRINGVVPFREPDLRTRTSYFSKNANAELSLESRGKKMEGCFAFLLK
uniref:Omp85 domain-containing protein n=1 Tax=Mesocestoides corti TaxID=53468 RepID=A0A5K3EST4_MESCO